MEESFVEKVRKAVSEGDFDTGELLFLEEVEREEAGFAELRAAALIVAEAGEPQRAAGMLTMLLPRAQAAGPQVHLDLLRQIVCCEPRNRGHRRAFTTTFNRYYQNDEQALAFCRAADITNTKNPAEAFENLDLLLKLREGTYVEHPGGWGVGKIKKVLTLTGHIEVDLEGRKGHRVNIGAAASIFRPLPPEHFSALCYDRLSEVKRMAEQDPLSLVRCLLRSFGTPQAVSDIRNRLVPAVLPKEKWSGWWNRARTAMKRDPYLRVLRGPKARLELLSEPRSEEEELLARFHEEGTRGRVATVRKFRQKPPEKQASLCEAIEKLQLQGPAAELEKLLLKHVLGVVDRREVGRFLRELPDPVAGVNALQSDELRREAVRAMAEEGDTEALLSMWYGGSPGIVYEVGRLLSEKDPERFSRALREVYEQPRRYPLLFFSLTQAWAEGRFGNAVKELPAEELLLRHVALLDYLFRAERRQSSREVVGFGRQVLTARKCACFRCLVDSATSSSLDQITAQLKANRALREGTKALMLEYLAVRKAEVSPPEKAQPVAGGAGTGGDRIYTTSEALTQRKRQYEKLVHEKIPQVIEEVGRAQAFGDLSENAEWTAALEKRDHLAARAREMHTELNKAVVITAEHYQEGRISLGCRFTARNTLTGKVHSWRLLGPWDAEIYPDALSYLSPIGQALVGRQEGDVVEVPLPEGTVTLEILTIEPALSAPVPPADTNEQGAP